MTHVPRKTKTLLLCAVGAISLLQSHSVAAQDGDVVVMRRVITKSNRIRPTPVPTPTPTPAATPTPAPPASGGGEWVAGPYNWVPGTPTCAHGVGRTRSVICRRNGVRVDNSQCSAAIPERAGYADRFEGCGYAWSVGQYVESTETCSASAVRTRTVACIRSGDGIAGETASDSECTGAKPEATQAAPTFAGCGYAWSAGKFGDWSAACSADAVRTRTVSCTRSDKTTVDDAMCAGDKPAAIERGNTQGCGEFWAIGDWKYDDAASACDDKAVQRRTVRCSAADGTTLDDARCGGMRPPNVQTTERTDACSYDWQVGPFTAFDSQCSADTTRTRSVQCMRSGGGSTPKTVPEYNCRTDKPVTTEHASDLSSCGYAWSAEAWSREDTTCGKSVQSRVVNCLRSDRTIVDDALCSGTKPDRERTVDVTSGCGRPAWRYTDWTFAPDASTCSASAVQTRTAVCAKGQDVLDDAECQDPRGLLTRTWENRSGCTYSWVVGEYGPYMSSCAPNAVRSRSVQCMSDGADPKSAPSDKCTAAKPASSETMAIYSGCGFQWKVGDWTKPTNTCGDNSETRSVVCTRSDGLAVGDASCAAKPKPETSRVEKVTSGCGYDWSYTDWQYVQGGTTCGKAPQTRTAVDCTQGGRIVDPTMCTAVPKVLTRDFDRTDGCSYFWAQGGFGAYSPSCSPNATATQVVQCQMSVDGGAPVVVQDESKCLSTGQKPASSKTGANFAGCGLSWERGTPSYSSQCSSNATATYEVRCKRADWLNDGKGSYVDPQMCVNAGSAAGTKPAATETGIAIYAGCNTVFSEGFEDGGTKWVKNWGNPSFPSTALAHGGSKAALLPAVSSGNPSDISYNGYITVPANTKMRLVVWARSVGSGSQFITQMYSGSAYIVGNATNKVTSTWAPYTYDFTSPTGRTTLRFLGLSGPPNPDFIIDDVSIFAVP